MTDPFNPAALTDAEALHDALIGEIAILHANATSLYMLGDEEGRELMMSGAEVLTGHMDEARTIIALGKVRQRIQDAEAAYERLAAKRPL